MKDADRGSTTESEMLRWEDDGGAPAWPHKRKELVDEVGYA